MEQAQVVIATSEPSRIPAWPKTSRPGGRAACRGSREFRLPGLGLEGW
jgi:hypothetical protein